MIFEIITIGKNAPHWAQTAVAQYQKRLPKHWRVVWHELPSSIADTPKSRCEQEGKAILARLPQTRTTGIALSADGQPMHSRQWAQHLESCMTNSKSIAMIIGGSDGLSRSVLNACDHCISLSPMTFPHALVRVILMEQIYRAWSILNHHPYHK